MEAIIGLVVGVVIVIGWLGKTFVKEFMKKFW